MLSAGGISKTYRSGGSPVTAVEDVSLEVRPGERLGLAGPSGCGKSTLAQVLALLVEPDRGSVTLDSTPVRRWGVGSPRELRRQVQLLWQSPRLATDPRMTLEQVIAEPLAAGGLGRGRGSCEPALSYWTEEIGLTRELLDRYPHEVSEGQLQRACLARALVLEPRYLICDEPTSMLDISTQAALLAAISREQERSELGVLLITHDRTLAGHWCQRVLQMDSGRLRTEHRQPSEQRL